MAELVEAALAVTPVGGAVRVVIEADALDALDVPLPVAVTVKV